MVTVYISDELKKYVPELTLSCLESDVFINESDKNLWAEIDKKIEEISSVLTIDKIKNISPITASRKAYRACGKDPARYRLSAEALMRRSLQGKGLYRVNNVVDLVNLVSLSTGFSIGGYDVDKIKGDVVFGIGGKGELYNGIGRGKLNVDSLPLFRDQIGAFGSATSDSVRTSVTSETKKFLMVIIGFGGEKDLKETTDLSVSMLKKYAMAKSIKVKMVV